MFLEKSECLETCPERLEWLLGDSVTSARLVFPVGHGPHHILTHLDSLAALLISVAWLASDI